MKSYRTFKDTMAAYLWWLKVTINSMHGYSKPDRYHSFEKKSVLLLAWGFPPYVGGGGVYRPTSFVKYATEFGWNISIIAGPKPNLISSAGLQLLSKIPRNVNIKRIQPSTLYPSWNWFFRVDGGFINSLSIYNIAKKILNESVPDVVMATGPPFHTFIAAYYLAKYFRSRLVLDYRDEWSQCPFSFVKLGNSDSKWEKICLRKADAVFFTTQSQLKHQLDVFYGVERDKFWVVPNGWEPDDFSGNFQENKKYIYHECSLNISFVGNLANHTLPGDFLKTFKDVVDRRPDLKRIIRIQFIGQKSIEALNQISEFPYSEMIYIVDQLPKAEANEAMKSSSALLLINNKSLKRYIPGKLYDYIASGRPILSYGDKGEVGFIIKNLNAGITIQENDYKSLEFALEQILFRERNHIISDREKINKWLMQHTRREMAKKMILILSSICQKK